MSAGGGGAAAGPPEKEGTHAGEMDAGHAASAPAPGPRPSPASPSHPTPPTPPSTTITTHAAADAGGLSDAWREILSSRMGVAGVAILAALIITSAATIIVIPVETLQEWNNPKSWISYPKAAVPAWTNAVLPQKIPEHMILDDPAVSERTMSGGGASSMITATEHEFTVDYKYDDFPSDFIYSFSAAYGGSPLLEVSVDRPDGSTILLLSKALPHIAADREGAGGLAGHGGAAVHSERVFSTDSTIRKNIEMQAPSIYKHDTSGASAEDVLFSDAEDGSVLRGAYTFRVTVSSLEGFDMLESRLVVGGKAFGIMGTDELRRDLAVGLLWGTPLALFIGITVAVASVVAGLLYGVYAGYRGKKTDEAMMRFNDVIYALPALPFLIILSVTVSNSILLMVGFLAMFGWVGVAKVARSMSLQIKTRGYVDAAETMGQSRSKIITRHIVPQLLPYAFASIAISVPAAITTEAGLSFLGLGDPSFPTWGQILHDANTFGAAARGLWWWMVPPGVMIAITGLAFVFIGNAMDSIVNPRLRRR